jgi:hypothetical protein
MGVWISREYGIVLVASSLAVSLHELKECSSFTPWWPLELHHSGCRDLLLELTRAYRCCQVGVKCVGKAGSMGCNGA